MPALKQYIWSETAAGINLNLFIGSTAKLRTPAGEADVSLETDYPWDGNVKVTVNPATEGSSFVFGIRIPAWTGSAPFAGNLYRYVTPASGKVVIRINGKKVKALIVNGFALLEREWKSGDVVEISLPMEPRFIKARDEVMADSGRVAGGMGPVVYCLEEVDNGPVREVTVDPSVRPQFTFEKGLLENVGTLKFAVTDPSGVLKDAKAVPYYFWANRGRGEMTVWIKSKQ
jgi:DUF1680 family protein